MPPYQIRFDSAANRLHLTLAGFWTLDTVHDFGREIRAVVDRMPPGRKTFDVLSDTSDFPVQGAEVSVAMGELMAHSLAMSSGPAAIVVRGMLNKSQAERTLAGPRVAIFLTRAEAEAWLAAQ